ncbi:hypothetical protein HDU76_003491 [Blyttiomyces sp. JEL0837]|nr:hypothetical protein HDU76_003491 [Blyttiomyces sp. JEL0837]
MISSNMQGKPMLMDDLNNGKRNDVNVMGHQYGGHYQQYQQHHHQGNGPMGQYQNQGQFSGHSPYGMNQFQGMPGNSGQYAAAGGNSSGMVNAGMQNRTVYMGNLPAGTTYEEVMNHVKFGPVEQVKLLEDKNCAFITFIESSAAMNFHADSQTRRILVGGATGTAPVEVKIGWGKPSMCQPTILAAVQSGATRNVFIGNIDETFTEQVLATELSRFGPIDQVKILAEKRIAFVHMASVSAAMKAVGTLPNEPRFVGRRVNYGKDRCGSFTPGHGPVQQPINNMGATQFDNFYSQTSPGNRTVYLGGIHQDAATKDLCDVIRGGILQNIKYMPEKNIAFVTFIDPGAALAFFNRGNNEGVVVKGKRVKVGWGKPSAMPMSISSAVQTGASRNVYLGSIDASVTEERLRQDFGEFGEIELVNLIPDKNIGFVNFTDIASAVKAVESMKTHQEYSTFKISFGKDRCGNPPRPAREGFEGHAPGGGSAGASGSAAAGAAGAGAGAAPAAARPQSAAAVVAANV